MQQMAMQQQMGAMPCARKSAKTLEHLKVREVGPEGWTHQVFISTTPVDARQDAEHVNNLWDVCPVFGVVFPCRWSLEFFLMAAMLDWRHMLDSGGK